MIDIPTALEERYGKAHLSYSSLKVALDDMAKFDLYMKRKIKFESPALTFGTLYDMLLFERERAMDEYTILSDDKVLDLCSDATKKMKKPKLSSDFKNVKAQFLEEAESNGKTICSPEDWKMANEMIDRLDVCGLTNQYLSSGNYQVEFNEMIGPVKVRGFLDCLGDGYIVDSKSTKSISKFRYSVRDFSYDIQAYIYTKVFGVSEFYWLAQEKTNPYLPAIIQCSEETLFAGEMKFNDAIERIEKFLREGDNPVQDYLQFKI